MQALFHLLSDERRHWLFAARGGSDPGGSDRCIALSRQWWKFIDRLLPLHQRCAPMLVELFDLFQALRIRHSLTFRATHQDGVAATTRRFGRKAVGQHRQIFRMDVGDQPQRRPVALLHDLDHGMDRVAHVKDKAQPQQLRHPQRQRRYRMNNGSPVILTFHEVKPCG
jgi:hypothetical protein